RRCERHPEIPGDAAARERSGGLAAPHDPRSAVRAGAGGHGHGVVHGGPAEGAEHVQPRFEDHSRGALPTTVDLDVAAVDAHQPAGHGELARRVDARDLLAGRAYEDGGNQQPRRSQADPLQNASHVPLSLVRRSMMVRRSLSATAERCSTVSLTMAGAVTGDPLMKGGAGSYSIASWISCATSSPNISAAITRARSIPAVTPPPVIRLRSITTRSCTGMAPKSCRSSCDIQCVVARYPSSRPAAPRSSAPLHTEVVYRALVPRSRRNAMSSRLSSAWLTPQPPGTQMTSKSEEDSNVASGINVIPHSVRTGAIEDESSVTFVEGIRLNTSYGPVRSSCVRSGNSTIATLVDNGVSGREEGFNEHGSVP